MGSGEPTELIFTTHRHELRGGQGVGNAGGRGRYRAERGSRGEKNWDNCNSIINKIYFKNGQKFFRAASCGYG